MIEQTMSDSKQTPSRIPVRFVDEDKRGRQRRASAGGEEDEAGGLTPEEIGRASIYEGETEVARRIERGEEGEGEAGRGDADERDRAGSIPRSELDEGREDQDTAARPDARPGAEESATNPAEEGEPPRQAGHAGGPQMAELVATRAELRRVEGELRKLREERQELTDKLARRQADFDNYRKRVERERGETHARVVVEVVGQLLPVVDNLQRALDAEASVEANESAEFRHFLHGVGLIQKQLNNVLESLGVQPVETVGQPFDPHVHEAIAVEETDEFAPDTVVAEMARGYRIGEKLLRPAMVKVAK